MWILGNWGQSEPWNRTSGVKMTKGEDGVYTGVLALPKGTEFDLKIVRSTVDGTSGGNDTWSAVRYASVLNSCSRYDFGEFVDNLVPNGDFEEGTAKWTPSNCIIERDYAISGDHCLALVSDTAPSASSDTFVIPPNQKLKYTTSFCPWADDALVQIKIEDVNTKSVLFESSVMSQAVEKWTSFAGTFETGDMPVTARITLTLTSGYVFAFDDMWLGS